jgi:hypothetical protein
LGKEIGHKLIRSYFFLQSSPFLQDVVIHVTDEEIRKMMSTRAIIDAASDGGHDPKTGIISFGWTITINEKDIAHGKGPAEAHHQLADSFRAEAYGLAAVSSFIQTLIAHFKVQPKNHRWFIYIDNKKLIARMESYDKDKRTAKWSRYPDIDITDLAHGNLRDVSAQFIHVKSHQGKQTTAQTPPSIRLNERADDLVKQQRAIMTRPITSISGQHCHLTIGEMTVTRDLKTWTM